MAKPAQHCVVLARGRLGEDLVARLAATGAFQTVVLLRVLADGDGRSAEPDNAVDVYRGAAASRLAELLAEAQATVVFDVAVSESPLVPTSAALLDRRRANVLAGALTRLHARGISIARVVSLSSTAVYGVASDTPLLFEETDAFQPATDPWVLGLRAAEQTLIDATGICATNLVRLRAASVLGGGFRSPLAAWLEAPLFVRATGWNPPVQCLAYADLLEACQMAALEAASGPINLVGRGTSSLSRLAEAGGRPRLALPGPLADRLQAAGSYGSALLRGRCIADGSRARQLFGFAAARGLEEAVRERS